MEIFTIKGKREFALSRYPDSSEPIAFPKNPTVFSPAHAYTYEQ